jgi:hypothetical protein
MCINGLLDDVKKFIDNKLVNEADITDGIRNAYSYNKPNVFAELLKRGAIFNIDITYEMTPMYYNLFLTHTHKKNLKPHTNNKIMFIINNNEVLEQMISLGFNINANDSYLLNSCLLNGWYSRALELINDYGANPRVLTNEVYYKIKRDKESTSNIEKDKFTKVEDFNLIYQMTEDLVSCLDNKNFYVYYESKNNIFGGTIEYYKKNGAYQKQKRKLIHELKFRKGTYYVVDARELSSTMNVDYNLALSIFINAKRL